jgi:hypothetical protein
MVGRAGTVGSVPRDEEGGMSESDARTGEAGNVWSARDQPDGPDLETPEADAVEQQREVVDTAPDEPPEVPYDVNPADAAEQSRTVGYDEDDYR